MNSFSIPSFALLVFSQTAFGQVAISPDGAMIAVGTPNGIFRLIETKDGEVVETIRTMQESPHPASSINRTPSLIFSPNGLVLASCCGDQEVSLWRVSNLSDSTRIGRIRVLDGPTTVGAELQFSRTGLYLTRRSMDTKVGPERVSLWNCETGQRLISLTSSCTHSGKSSAQIANRIAFIEAHNRLVLDVEDQGGQWKVVIVDLNSGDEIARVRVSSTYSWQVSPRGRTLVDSAHENGRQIVKTWDLSDGALKHTIADPPLPNKTKQRQKLDRQGSESSP